LHFPLWWLYICRLHKLWIEFGRDQCYTMECGSIEILLLNQFMIIESGDFLVPWQTASVSYVDMASQKFHKLWHVNWYLRFLQFWNVMQHWLLCGYRHFRTTCHCHLRGLDSLWPLKMGPIGCPKTSVTDYQSSLHNFSVEQSSHLHCVRSLKSCIIEFISHSLSLPPQCLFAERCLGFVGWACQPRSEVHSRKKFSSWKD
jgi:hypothetical protein